MNWLCKKSIHYIAIFAPLAIAVPAVLYSGSVNKGYSYKPSISLPDISSEPGSETQSVQMAFLPGDNLTLSPFPLQPLRSAFSSRSAISTRLIDWRLFRDELGSYEIELKSDPDEMTNVQLAANAINGVIVQPFDTFSFNAAVGERSGERGFRSGLMFSNGEVISGIGGGVCLVSTALYNCALEAGCKIIERAHHSGPVRYAGPGLDAAVVYGTLDMRFKNDTPSPKLIQAKVEDGRLIVSINGKKQPGYSVEIVKSGYKELPYKIIEVEDPALPDGEVKVKTPARTGYDVSIARIIRQDGKIIKREDMNHDYMPARNKVVLIPPKPKEEQLEEPKPVQVCEPAEPKCAECKEEKLQGEGINVELDKQPPHTP
ncbi:MAG: VanW family protein [Armatimonadota bacterium]